MQEFHLEQFQGPLDILLSLIESKKLDITKIALAEVTKQYLEILESKEDSMPLEELADFLLVASRLLLLKSRVLLPFFSLEDEEEVHLEKELRMYKLYIDATKEVEKIWKCDSRSFARMRKIEKGSVVFSPPVGCTPTVLQKTFERFLKTLEPFRTLPEKIYNRVVSLPDKIEAMRNLLRIQKKIFFHVLFEENTHPSHIVISFLAILQLLKEGHIMTRQKGYCMDIEIIRV